MKVELKKVVIIIIFFVIIYASTIFYYEGMLNEAYDIKIISHTANTRSQTLGVIIEDQMRAYTSELQSETRQYNVSLVTNETASEASVILTNEIVGEEIVFIIGNEYNDDLEATIIQNPNIRFILVNNTGYEVARNLNTNNVSYLTIDNEDIIKTSAKTLINEVESKKYLFIDVQSNELKDDEYKIFQDEIKTNKNNQTASFYIEENESIIDLQKQVEKYYELGYDGIYINSLDYTTDILDISTKYEETKYNEFLQKDEKLKEVTTKLEDLKEEIKKAEENELTGANEEEIKKLKKEEEKLEKEKEELDKLVYKPLQIDLWKSYTYNSTVIETEEESFDLVHANVIFDFNHFFDELYEDTVNEDVQKNYDLKEDEGLTYEVVKEQIIESSN